MDRIGRRQTDLSDVMRSESLMRQKEDESRYQQKVHGVAMVVYPAVVDSWTSRVVAQDSPTAVNEGMCTNSLVALQQSARAHGCWDTACAATRRVRGQTSQAPTGHGYSMRTPNVHTKHKPKLNTSSTPSKNQGFCAGVCSNDSPAVPPVEAVARKDGLSGETP